MARRPRRPGASPAALLAAGASWLDEAPSFSTGGNLLDAEVLADLHRSSRLIARRRDELGLTQVQVSAWAGVTRQTIAALEDGTAWPDHLTVVKVCSVLGITVRTEVLPGRPIGPRQPSTLYRGH